MQSTIGIPAIAPLVGGETMAAFRQRGTTGIELWNAAAVCTASVGTASPVGVNTLIALPYPTYCTQDIDRIQFEITTGGGAGAKSRVGIYQATSQTNTYPAALVVDGGEFNSVAGQEGVKTTTIAVTLHAGLLYWFVYLCGTAASTCRTTTNGATFAIGIDKAMGANTIYNSLSVAATYGALSTLDPFPAGAVGALTVSPPIICVRNLATP